MYLIKTVFKSPTGHDTTEEEYADSPEWLYKKVTRIIKRWSDILALTLYDDINLTIAVLENRGLRVNVYEQKLLEEMIHSKKC